MKAKLFRGLAPILLAVVPSAFIPGAWLGINAQADQIQMQNGDRYAGNILSLSNDTLLLQSEMLGTVRLPRSKVAYIALGASSLTNAPLPAGVPNALTRPARNPATNNAAGLSDPIRQLASNSNLIHQIQSQYLSDATPEAGDMFNQMLGGLLSGKLGVQDIRAQAQSTAAQVRAMRKDLGDEAGWMLDTYLAILDHFVKETTPTSNMVVSNAVPPLKPPKPAVSPEQD